MLLLRIIRIQRNSRRPKASNQDTASNQDRTSQARPSGQDGFTLIELLVVLAILGLLVGFVGPALIRQLGSAKHRVAEQSVERISGILDFYKLDVGAYPTTDQGLDALNGGPVGVTGWNGPYLK